MIESIGPNPFYVTLATQSLMHIWTNTPVAGEISWIEDFNHAVTSLASTMPFPHQVQFLIKELNQAAQWGHALKMRRVAARLLPYFTTSLN